MKVATREDVRRAAGHALVCGFEGTQVSAELREVLREVRPLGLILFARNVESPAQVRELAAELKALRDEPLLLSIDQEGGRVARVRAPATEWPPLREIGRAGDASLAERLGRALAREVRAMGLDVDYAPVLDVDTNPENPVIGDRSFGSDPERVAELGAAFVRGMQDAGVGACGKHFPGHGDTATDSHLTLPYIEHDLERLRAVEWPPFAAAVRAGVGAMMTAHVMVPALDEERPGTLSPTILGHLRGELGFEGVILSDDVEMKAIAERHAPAEIAVSGMQAGLDGFLACRDYAVTLELYRGIVQGVERDALTHETLLGTERRMLAWRERFCRPVEPPDALREVGCEQHVALAREICACADQATPHRSPEA